MAVFKGTPEVGEAGLMTANAQLVVDNSDKGLLTLEQWAFVAGLGMFISFVMILFTLIRGALKSARERKAARSASR